MSTDRIEQAKSLTDVASYFIALGVLVDALPKIAAALTVLWLCIQISQSHRFAQMVALCRRLGRWIANLRR